MILTIAQRFSLASSSTDSTEFSVRHDRAARFQLALREEK